jgi:uncharacterized protein
VVVPSSRSLEPATWHADVVVDEVFMTQEQFEERDDKYDEEEIIVLEKDLIDLNESVAENLVLNIPMRILTEEEENSDELPSGNNWEVISEEEYENRSRVDEETETIDPRFAALKNLSLSDEED